jgi:hypothetical protein
VRWEDRSCAGRGLGEGKRKRGARLTSGPHQGVAAAAQPPAWGTREGSGGGGTAGPPNRPKAGEGRGGELGCRGAAGPKGEEGGREKRKGFSFFSLNLDEWFFTISINQNKCMVRHGAANKIKYF